MMVIKQKIRMYSTITTVKQNVCDESTYKMYLNVTVYMIQSI